MINLIEKLRKSIDEIDGRIIKNLAERKNLVMKIAALKKSMKLPVHDSKREKSMLESLKKSARDSGLDEDLIGSIFNLIFENSRLEQEIRNSVQKCRIKEIGLIGCGRFGKLAARYLSEDFRVHVFDRNNKFGGKKNIVASALGEACKKNIVVLAVPISEFENTLKDAAPLINKSTLVIDVCSVKEYPAKLMRKLFAKNIRVLATHPLFGPDSASDSLAGRKIALCRVRVDDGLYNQVKAYLKSKGLAVIETTPQEHDMQMAKSLVLSHLIGRALIEMKAGNLEIDTRGYRDLVKIVDAVRHDSLQLFEDMNHYNRFSKKSRKEFIKSMLNVEKRLEK